MISRRDFIGAAAGAAAALAAGGEAKTEHIALGNAQLQSVYDAALSGLKGNIRTLYKFSRPVLVEGAEYLGVWLECAPYEGLVYEPIAPEIALNNHQIFFALQREDGYLPCSVKQTQIGTGQIQMVVPIAATAWDLYQRNRNTAFLEQAYRACSRWDDWLKRYRNTRGTGLCEAFCTYDTGQDNSPRFAGKPRQCPNHDARICPQVAGLPYLAPDLSATVYGGRIALAAMAAELGRSSEQSRWLESAAAIRKLIVDRLYDPHDGAFYDLDSNNQFVRVRGTAILRVMGEHVATKDIFDQVYRLQIGNPHAFWAPYPFPSIALDDPTFVRPIPRNSWGGASQALTALRTPRWMEYYGKYADFTHLMTQWVKAIAVQKSFLQQMDPLNGKFTTLGKPGYSPAMLVFFDFAWRLYGVRPEGNRLEWNCRLPEGSNECVSTIRTSRGDAELRTKRSGAVLSIAGKKIATVEGEARLVTDAAGIPQQLIGTANRAMNIAVDYGGKKIRRRLQPDEIHNL